MGTRQVSTPHPSPPPADVVAPAALAYRFRVGAVGHRNLADPEAVRAAVDAIVDRLAATLAAGDGPPVAWTVVTPAAKGADRIVAQSVLDRCESAQIEIITPFAIDEYRRDFDTADDRAAFDALAERAQTIAQRNADAPPTDMTERCVGYLDAGRAVVDACEVLIAIWDGQPARGVGGTGDAVAYAASLGRLVLCIDASDPAVPPRRVVAADVRDQAPPNPARPLDAGHRVRLAEAPVPADAAELSPGYAAQSAYLTRGGLSDARYAGAYLRAAATVREHAAVANLDEQTTRALLGHLLPHQVRACALAARHQRLHVAASMGVFVLSAAAVTVAVFQGMFMPDVWALTLLELALVGGAVAAFALNRRGRWHEHWLHDRYLAEQLRVALYTVPLSGDDPEPPPHPADRLPFYAGPQGWLPAMVRTLVGGFPGDAKPSPAAARAFVLHGWLREQAAWHHRNALQKSRIARRLRWTAIGALIASATLSAVVIAVSLTGSGGAVAQVLSLLSIVLPAWAAAAHGVSKLLEYERVAARSAQMAQLMGLFHDRAAVAGTGPAFRRVLNEAAHTAALENYEWWVVLSFDQPDLV